MLFRKSPGNEKFVLLKCMLNAKTRGIYYENARVPAPNKIADAGGVD